MKKLLQYSIKIILTFCLVIISYFAYYCAFYGLQHIEIAEQYPSRDLITEVTRYSVIAAGNTIIALIYPLLFLVWVKKRNLWYRLSYFILFSAVCIPIMYYFSSLLLAIILLPIFAFQYNTLLNKPLFLFSKIKNIFSGCYLHHRGIARICIVTGILCIPFSIWYYTQIVWEVNIFTLFLIALLSYFTPFLFYLFYQHIIYKIYLWITAGFIRP